MSLNSPKSHILNKVNSIQKLKKSLSKPIDPPKKQKDDLSDLKDESSLVISADSPEKEQHQMGLIEWVKGFFCKDSEISMLRFAKHNLRKQLNINQILTQLNEFEKLKDILLTEN